MPPLHVSEKSEMVVFRSVFITPELAPTFMTTLQFFLGATSPALPDNRKEGEQAERLPAVLTPKSASSIHSKKALHNNMSVYVVIKIG